MTGKSYDDTSFEDDQCAYRDLTTTGFCQNNPALFDWQRCQVPICLAVTEKPECSYLFVPDCHGNFTVPSTLPCASRSWPVCSPTVYAAHA